MNPPFPTTALPVSTENAPLLPELVVPVLIWMCPLTPLAAAFWVEMAMLPLDVAAPYPDFHMNDPPRPLRE